MNLYISNTDTCDVANIRIKNQNHKAHIVKVISNILGKEPYHEYSDDKSALTICLSAAEINILFEHAKETDEDLARIISVDQLGPLRGIKDIHY